jgi:hypothetical protein
VICAASIVFMVRFLIALQKEGRRAVVGHPVYVRRGAEFGQFRGSRVPDLKLVWCNSEIVHHRRKLGVA